MRSFPKSTFSFSVIRIIWAVACAILVATAFFPIYVPMHQTQPTSIIGLLHLFPGAVIIPLLFLGALVISILRRKYSQGVAVGLAALGSIGTLLLNSLTNTDVSTPEPYTSLAIITYFAMIFTGGAILIRQAYRYRLKRHPEVKAKLEEAKQLRKKAIKQRQSKVKELALKTLPTTIIDYQRGALFALGGPVIGAIIWLCIWELGFIASIAAYIMAKLTVNLYRKGSGSHLIDKRSAYVILGYIFLGILLSLFATFTSDSVQYLLQHNLKGQHVGVLDVLANRVFWQWNIQSLFTVAVIKGYAGAFAMGIGLSVLGVWGTISGVLLPQSKAVEQAKAELATNPSSSIHD